jgi:hypothetical protein
MSQLENPTNDSSPINWAALINEIPTIKVRCPDCYKLYNIRTQDIHVSQPKFKCTGCEKKFWIGYPEALEHPEGVIGFPLDWAEPQTAAEAAAQPEPIIQNFECPKCQNLYLSHQKECMKCGLIFEKYQQKELAENIRKASRSEDAHPAIAQHKEIKDEWENVVQNFESFNSHQNFIRVCQKLEAIDYAVAKYSELNELCPQDQNVTKALRQCMALHSVQIDFENARLKESSKRTGTTKNAWLKKLNLSFDYPIIKTLLGIRASTAFVVFGLGIIALGLSQPHLRNLVGVGCSVAFLGFAMRFLR